MMKFLTSTFLILYGLMASCKMDDPAIRTGADQMDLYMPLIGGKQIALVANQTSLVDGTHLVDTLLSSGLRKAQLMRVFAPEHGFRGKLAAGVQVSNGIDPFTGIQVISLYGKHKKPTPKDLDGIDLVIFDLQDVGTRFYTYISTLHFVMEACAENGVSLLVLDRPNPNDGYVDGPVLEEAYTSFVGMHPIPVVYGLTIGELAMMINGEGWLRDGVSCDLNVIPCAHYVREQPYSLPVSPSPNLTNDHSILMYPSTCFFEGTVISEGRGTSHPFELYGHPLLSGEFSFTPVAIAGVSGNPKFRDKLCHGVDLSAYEPTHGWTRINLKWILDAYADFPVKETFFTSYFEKLAGTARLRQQIESGWDESRIRASWQDDLERYKLMRKKYLIYDD